MTKRGSLDNVVTYEHICDTFADVANIDPHYVTLGSVCIVLQGESGGLEVYMAGTNGEWQTLMENNAGSGAEGGVSAHICASDEYDATSGLPTIAEPSDTTFYLVPGTAATNNLYNEFIYVDGEWELIGGGAVSLNIAQADWDEESTDSDAYILNKPTPITNIEIDNLIKQ